MANFYGWTNDQILDLDVDSFDEYWQSITIIEAQEMLKQFNVSDWPNMKQNNRESLHRRLFQDAYPDSFKEVRKIETSDLAKILGG
jgi:hypothetical protein